MPAVSDQDRNTVVVAAFTAGLMIAQQVAARATRDSLFLGRYDAQHLPFAMLVGAAGSLVAVIVFSRLIRLRGPQQVVPAAFVFNAGLFVVEWLIFS